MSRNRLGNIIALLKEKTTDHSEDIIYNFTADGNSVVVGRKSKNRAGLIVMRDDDGGVSFYIIKIGRWNWAKTEGFSKEEISSKEALRKDIFRPVTKNKFIEEIAGD